MDQIRIRGSARPLQGTLSISGAKNAALPMMIASLLSDQPLTLHNVPDLTDVSALQRLLCELGVDVTFRGRINLNSNSIVSGDSEKMASAFAQGRSVTLHCPDVSNTTAEYDLVRKMRASFWVLGPILARCGRAKVSLPGGCAIGSRPVDLHLEGLRKLGAILEIESGYVLAKAPRSGLCGTEIVLPFPSVGATITLISAAVLANGETVIQNAACEPEVAAVCECLVAMGACIDGIGSNRLKIAGPTNWVEASFAVPPDRIETGTFAAAAAITGGDVVLKNARADHLHAFLQVLNEIGVESSTTSDGLRIKRTGALNPISVQTAPYPGVPTDLQAQLMALLCLAPGKSSIQETIFENRFMHVPELARMGANIQLRGDTAEIYGVDRLKGAQVMATDLRASVSLVIAGLVASGETVVNRVYHLDRGFSRLESRLANCGADIERISI